MRRLLVLSAVCTIAACGDDADPQLDAGGEDDASAVGDATAADGGPDAVGAADEGSGDAGDGGSAGGDVTLPQSFEATAEDFGCLKAWTPVRGFYLTNLLGLEAEAVAVAEAGFVEAVPPGTVIQLVPLEAMVKGLPGSRPETDDWEFFLLSYTAAGTVIEQRGGVEVENAAGSCASCHFGASERDLVCEQTGLCSAAAVPRVIVDRLVENDPRCP
jgi:hypothetical protein